MDKKAFYAPKVAICLAIFLGLWAFQYADMKEFQAYADGNFVNDEEA